jgi:hypothetical protein
LINSQYETVSTFDKSGGSELTLLLVLLICVIAGISFRLLDWLTEIASIFDDLPQLVQKPSVSRIPVVTTIILMINFLNIILF